MIRKWLKRRRERIARQNFQRGYDWAAGLLLIGVPDHAVDGYLDNPLDSGAFEKGGRQALFDFRRLVSHA